MISKNDFRIRWWYPAAVVALLVILGVSGLGTARGVLASRPNSGQTVSSQSGHAEGWQLTNDAPYVQNAYMVLAPDTTTVGTCPAPANGGTTQVGCTFVLDLFLNTGANPDATAQQSYMTYTYQTVQNARVSSIGTSCVPTNTVTGDLNTFDAALQNEVCNGPDPCLFRGLSVAPGSFAYASGALNNCPQGCGGYFRIAQVGLCATSAGQARFRWQFAPTQPCSTGAPITRDTEIVAASTELIQNCALFTTYTFTVTGPPTATGTPALTATATETSTPGPPTETRTPGPPTETFTSTPVTTGTPCDRCQANVKDVDLTCNPDGTLHWTGTVRNNAECTLTVPYRVVLQARSHPPHPEWTDAQTQRGSVTVPPDSEVSISGDFCYPFPNGVDRLRVEVALDGSSHECMKKKKSHEIQPCDVTPQC